MKHEDLKKELLKDVNFSREYFKNDSWFELGRQMKKIRIKRGMTQKELASKMHTRQSSIARIECGKGGIQSNSLLKKFAEAVGVKFNPPSFSEYQNLNNKEDAANEFEKIYYEANQEIKNNGYIEMTFKAVSASLSV